MEGGAEGVEPEDPSSTEQKDEWMAEWLDALCPYYMFLGVSCEDFWHGDYTRLKYYAQAYDMNRQRKSEEMWLMGLYNHNAVTTAIGNAFREKGKKPLKYLEEPIRVTPYTEEEKAAIARQERENNINRFRLMMQNWEKQHGQ